jgi:hypothetical protein
MIRANVNLKKKGSGLVVMQRAVSKRRTDVAAFYLSPFSLSCCAPRCRRRHALARRPVRHLSSTTPLRASSPSRSARRDWRRGTGHDLEPGRRRKVGPLSLRPLLAAQEHHEDVDAAPRGGSGKTASTTRTFPFSRRAEWHAARIARQASSSQSCNTSLSITADT